MFCNLMNKDLLINNNQYSVVGGHKLIFLKMDPKYSKKKNYVYMDSKYSKKYKSCLYDCLYIYILL